MKRPAKITPEAALIRLESLCARSERCTSELMQKLRNWSIAPDAANDIIESLRSRRFLDDDRFARAYVREKYLFQHWGRHKITAQLYAKQIPADTIKEALTEIDLRTYANGAFALLQMRLRQLPAEMVHTERYRRLLAYGAQRGFESSLLHKILQSKRLWG